MFSGRGSSSGMSRSCLMIAACGSRVTSSSSSSRILCLMGCRCCLGVRFWGSDQFHHFSGSIRTSFSGTLQSRDGLLHTVIEDDNFLHHSCQPRVYSIPLVAYEEGLLTVTRRTRSLGSLETFAERIAVESTLDLDKETVLFSRRLSASIFLRSQNPPSVALTTLIRQLELATFCCQFWYFVPRFVCGGAGSWRHHKKPSQ